MTKANLVIIGLQICFFCRIGPITCSPTRCHHIHYVSNLHNCFQVSSLVGIFDLMFLHQVTLLSKIICNVLLIGDTTDCVWLINYIPTRCHHITILPNILVSYQMSLLTLNDVLLSLHHVAPLICKYAISVPGVST